MSSPAPASSSPARSQLAALPNILTLVRIALVPLVVVVLMWSGPWARGFAAFLFLVAALTDFFDGWFARRHGASTALGQFLDPLADKLIVVACLIMLAATGPEPRVPAWMAVVIASRELAVTGLRGIASHGGIVIAADMLGKYKMVFQIFALVGLLAHYNYPIPGTGLRIDFHAAGMLFLWVAIVFTVWSAVDYTIHAARRVDLGGRAAG